MDSTRHKISDTTDVICRCACQLDARCECNRCEVWADAIYTVHVKPLEDALAAAKERERMLMEALERAERALVIIDSKKTGGTYYQKYADAVNTGLMKARAALARVKEVQDAE